MAPATRPMVADQEEREELERVFESVSRYFSLMSEPMRVRIMHTICDGERTVGDIVLAVGGTQTNVSRHLAALYQAHAVYRRKSGNHVFYGIQDSALIALCRGVCIHIASRLDDDGERSDGLLNLARGFDPAMPKSRPKAALKAREKRVTSKLPAPEVTPRGTKPAPRVHKRAQNDGHDE